jgi:hypothetical protein
MMYVVEIGPDNKSLQTWTVEAEPESLEENHYFIELEEAPTVGRWIKDGDNVRPMSDVEVTAELQEMALVSAANTNRRTRVQLLEDTDWTQVADVDLTDEEIAAYRTYRQALRDITEHDNWPMLEEGDWPTAP